MTNSSSASLSWCPIGMGMQDTQGNITLSPISIDEHEALPEITDTGHHLHCIYLPLEHLLLRSFNFPLKHVRFLDAGMLAQELADSAGIEPDDWWFSWAADTTEQGISGLVFGLPKAQKNAIQIASTWQQTPLLLIDGWQRLNHWVSDTTDIAIVDTDADGVFFGYYKQGIWQGMRRLNANMLDDTSAEEITPELLHTLKSMGFDIANNPMVGRVSSSMKHALQLPDEQSDITIEDDLKQRHIYNLKLDLPNKSSTHLLNLRHGKWSVKSSHAISRVWYRPAILATLLCIFWLGATGFQNHQLQQQLDTMNDGIIQAFHRGLPQQTVIIDAMAQLRQATNQNGNQNNTNTQHISQQLNIISEVFKKHAWKMQELNISDKGVIISGQVNSLDTLNTISNALREKTSGNVNIADTELKGDKVNFRIRWQ